MRTVRAVAVGLAIVLGVSGCLSGDDAVERGWGHPLATLPGEDGASWDLYAEDQLAATASVALVEWAGAEPSGRLVQGESDAYGTTTVTVETAEGPWSAAVDANGEVVWADPLPEDPSALAGAIGEAGLAAQGLEDSCTTCSGGIGPLVIGVIVVVVVVAAVALYTAFRDPPRKGTALPKPGPRPTTGQSSAGSSGASSAPAVDCGPPPQGDVRRDPAARRRRFEYLECLGRAGR